jgi:hypothetical protein
MIRLSRAGGAGDTVMGWLYATEGRVHGSGVAADVVARSVRGSA